MDHSILIRDTDKDKEAQSRSRLNNTNPSVGGRRNGFGRDV